MAIRGARGADGKEIVIPAHVVTNVLVRKGALWQITACRAAIPAPAPGKP